MTHNLFTPPEWPPYLPDVPASDPQSQQVALHNQACAEYAWDEMCMSMPAFLDPAEFAILSIGHGIYRWVTFHRSDGLFDATVSRPLLEAFIAALNGDTGDRLLCGRLEEWARAVADGLNLDLE